MAKVLVTGHEGCIGSLLTPLLRTAGHDVAGLDSVLLRACPISPGPPVPVGRPTSVLRPVPTIRKDIRDVDPSDLAGFDAVIHLAGLSNEPLGALAPALTQEINHLATVRLAVLAKGAGVARFLYASTCSIYGATSDTLADERGPLGAATPYAESKMRSEQDLARLADERFSPVCVRAATTYGAAPALRLDLAVNNLVAQAAVTGIVRVGSRDTSWWPLVHVEDLARAYLALLQAPRAVVHNQAFNVGRTGESYRTRDLAEVVRQTVPGARVELADDAGPERRNVRIDCDRIAGQLPSWRPRRTVADGAREVYLAIREAGLGDKDLERPRHGRIACIRELLREGRIDAGLRWRGPAGTDLRQPALEAS